MKHSDLIDQGSIVTITTALERQTVLLAGRESVGKSQLAAAWAKQPARSANFRGSTVHIEHYLTERFDLVDTPGILRTSDSETTRLALQEMSHHETVLLVVQATCLDEDLAEMLPLLKGKRGAVAVTFWDKVQPGEASQEALERLEKETGLRFIAMNARMPTTVTLAALEEAIEHSQAFPENPPKSKTGWRIESKPGILEGRFGAVFCLILLLIPALLTIFGANRLADLLHPLVAQAIQPAIEWVNASFPAWLAAPLTAEYDDFGYGLLNMGPFLLVWAFPAVLLFAVISAIYKTTGLIERINITLHPLVRPLGLSGRDLVRVLVGFGCNVPAVISTRACSSCSRGNAISAISFGAACSYQLPATLAVLSAGAVANGTNPLWPMIGYFAYLLVTTMIYLRLTSTSVSRDRLNMLMHFQRPFLQWPSWSAIYREMRGTLEQFLFQAMPIFVVICGVTSLLAYSGAIAVLSAALSPIMTIFNLPPSASVAMVMASIRKDGIFLLTPLEGATTPMTTLQFLTAVYLAGVLLPCLVTALQISREMGWQFAVKMMARQAIFASLFAALLGWSGTFWN